MEAVNRVDHSSLLDDGEVEADHSAVSVKKRKRKQPISGSLISSLFGASMKF